MKKTLLVGLALVLATTAIQAKEPAKSWQQSMSPSLELGVRDKYGETPYTAEFVVTDPKGVSTRHKVEVGAGEFGFARFPDDFENGMLMTGKYRWQALVDGKVVTQGKFAYRHLSKGASLSFVY